jgi:hypothetical protein
MNKLKGNIVMIKDDKVLFVCENKYYIAKGKGHIGDVEEFNSDECLPMPSYMFAIATMEEENLEDTLDFIKNKWFN